MIMVKVFYALDFSIWWVCFPLEHWDEPESSNTSKEGQLRWRPLCNPAERLRSSRKGVGRYKEPCAHHVLRMAASALVQLLRRLSESVATFNWPKSSVVTSTVRVSVSKYLFATSRSITHSGRQCNESYLGSFTRDCFDFCVVLLLETTIRERRDYRLFCRLPTLAWVISSPLLDVCCCGGFARCRVSLQRR